MEHSKKQNYKKIYAIKEERENRIKIICPNIPYSSGIYVFYRTDEAKIRRAYCGQAVNLCERCASHLGEYDHIALSLKKHGVYSKDNKNGWKLMFETCPKSELDEREIAMIKYFADNGFQMYNITAGGQSVGKQVVGQYKSPKTYREGIQAGKKSLARELSSIAKKHLKIEIREDKQNNKISQKQFKKFKELINLENYQEDKRNEID